MAERHINHLDLENIRQANRDMLAEHLVAGRHLPYQLGFTVVKMVMAEAGQTDFAPEYGDHIPDEIAQHPRVKGAVDKQIAGTDLSYAKSVDYPLAVSEAWSIHRTFLRDVRQGEGRLDKAKDAFRDRLMQASQDQRFPLKPEQIDARLSQTTLGFKDARQAKDVIGRYFPVAGQAYVDLGFGVAPGGERFLTSSNLHTVRHELTHVIGGQRFIHSDKNAKAEARKSGLRLPKGAREWADEAFAEILSTVLFDERGKTIDFSEAKQSITEVGNGVILDILGANPDLYIVDDVRSYRAQKVALLKAMSKVPFGTLVRAYTAQDFDPYETDQYAGTRAEKELQRALKIVGGTERIRELRLVDDDFSTGHELAAVDTAELIQWKDGSLTWRSKLVNHAAVYRNSRKVGSKIERAQRSMGGR